MRENFLNKKNWLFIFVLFSIIGWLYESALFFTRNLPFENRGFLFGPYLPIYGFGGLILIFIYFKLLPEKIKLKSLKISIKPVIVFIVILAFTTLMELIIGYILDKYFGLRLWDYSDRIYNFHGYICPGASVRFGIGGGAIVYGLFPLINKLFERKPKLVKYFSIILALIMLVDLGIKLLK